MFFGVQYHTVDIKPVNPSTVWLIINFEECCYDFSRKAFRQLFFSSCFGTGKEKGQILVMKDFNFLNQKKKLMKDLIFAGDFIYSHFFF